MTLFLIPTPIGNLKDITLRTIETINQLDEIICEDTRRTLKLLNYLKLKKSVESFFEHNEEKKIPKILKKLKEGKNIGLISDAGTPLICDPGFKLVREAIKNNIKIVALPGASSLLTGLLQSGFPPYPFIFFGYLPEKKKKREEFFKSLKEKKITKIIFSSPYKIKFHLKEMFEIIGDIDIYIGRELTKLYEENYYGKLSDAIKHFEKRDIKGEVLIIF